jgi:hypothetical protein
MAFSLVNKTIAATTATSGVVSPAWTMAAGDLVVAVLGLETSTVITAPTVTDSLGNTYTLRASQPTDSTSTGIFLFDSVLTTGGSGATITASWGGASFKFALAILEYSFSGSLGRDGTTAARSTTATSPMDPGNLVLTGSGRLVVSAGEIAGAVTYGAATGFTVEVFSNAAGQGHMAVEDATGQSGTVDPTIAVNVPHPWAAVAAAYYATGGASVPYWHLFRGSNSSLTDTP